MANGPRILVLDIETSPNLAHVWRLFQQNVSLSQLREVGQVISFAAQWHGEKRVEFHSDFNFETEELTGHKAMVQRAFEMIDEADMVVHYNGNHFDIPHLNREFLLQDLGLPSPHKNIDLLQTVRRRFRFASNKLDHVAQQLGVGGKVQHTGFDLWRRCLDGDPAAWRMMRRYNKGDVRITDKVYTKVRPWIANHPHVGLFVDDSKGMVEDVCSRCKGRLIRRGKRIVAQTRAYHRYQCVDCKSWHRGRTSIASVDVRGVL